MLAATTAPGGISQCIPLGGGMKPGADGGGRHVRGTDSGRRRALDVSLAVDCAQDGFGRAHDSPEIEVERAQRRVVRRARRSRRSHPRRSRRRSRGRRRRAPWSRRSSSSRCRSRRGRSMPVARSTSSRFDELNAPNVVLCTTSSPSCGASSERTAYSGFPRQNTSVMPARSSNAADPRPHPRRACRACPGARSRGRGRRPAARARGSPRRAARSSAREALVALVEVVGRAGLDALERLAEADAGGGVVVLHVDDEQGEPVPPQRDRRDERQPVVEERAGLGHSGRLRARGLLELRHRHVALGRLELRAPSRGRCAARGSGRRSTRPGCRRTPRGRCS